MEQLKELYSSHGYPAAERLYTIAKKAGVNVKIADVKEFIANQTTAQLHKKPKKVAENPITVDGKDTEYQMDLLDMGAYAKSNSNYKWILIIENVWDRKGAAIEIKTKSPNDVLPALQKAVKELNGLPVQIVSDSGNEFKGVVGEWMEEHKISHRTVEIGSHESLGVIDSLARFIKNALGKHFTHTQKTEWISYLPSLIRNFNDTPHSSLKAKGEPEMSPNEAGQFETDTRNIWLAKKESADKSKKPSGLSVGDHVRILKRKQVFQRGYSVRYSVAVYTIEKIDGLWYTLNNGEKYREGSIQKVKAPAVNDGEQKEEEPLIKDVQGQATFDARTEYKLRHEEGVSAENNRAGLRERKPQHMAMDDRYGKVSWS
jgi:hypothetical protein